ncbi:hypothetical protein G6F57_000304 [Rhizopus arrhizus]|uniref:DH domain-containing protein n=1 Tax=Rhizopus oryzae TaxID=64495 RepID=A0A9P6XL94_RHIOR|nr:hypothetical protein G6F23_006374 [Rhizopus arrhizus]KAG1429361.1 hypothetical protein G6F58_000081 [Rhizopus delemar]KAG0770423.1 hypothetical protein G6F24_000217 [Rhizopus arrhizus]KAG0794574.1 hypothetical protein G6F21_002770 [Rhizopus arrhizus]KAG0801243.1 hypothetical protein G6F22_001438 [Rhizopus arrhizus]
MPPYSYPVTFEELEAKEWASNTVKDILTDISPVSFESNLVNLEIIQEEEEIPKRKKKNQRESLKSVSTLRRSFSFLESNLFRNNHHEERKTTRSLSTVLTDYQLTTSNPVTPSLPKLSLQSSISSRIRHTWHVDRASISTKERKGIAMWKSTYAAYIVEPPPSLKYKPKVIDKMSIQLSKFIRTELLTTEETYLSHLMTIKNFYMDPLFRAASQKRSLVNLKDVEIIFAHIPQLISVSSAIAERLHKVIIGTPEEKSTNQEGSALFIGKTFCDFENYFDVYIAYAVNFSKSRKYLNKASSNIVYHQLVKDSIKKKENRMLLDDYMIAPIQRITRYCLLLKSLQKHSAPTDPDFTYLDKAIKCLSALAFAMNHVQ